MSTAGAVGQMNSARPRGLRKLFVSATALLAVYIRVPDHQHPRSQPGHTASLAAWTRGPDHPHPPVNPTFPAT